MNENKGLNLDITSFATFLTLLFFVLKIIGVISWSWWLVFLPVVVLYGFSAIVLIILTVAFLVQLHHKE